MTDTWASVLLLAAILALCAVLVVVVWATDPERKRTFSDDDIDALTDAVVKAARGDDT